jgi:polyribonucleotide nucleotidyltransferase
VTYCDYIQDEDGLDFHVQRIRTSRPTFIEVKVPHDYVGAIIGRGGSTIKDIQEKSNTRIIFKRKRKYFCGHIW